MHYKALVCKQLLTFLVFYSKRRESGCFIIISGS